MLSFCVVVINLALYPLQWACSQMLFTMIEILNLEVNLFLGTGLLAG